MKKTLLIDLDGVLNEYRGNFDKDYIPPMKNGAKEFLEELSKNYEIRIFTTRNKILTSDWIRENGLSEYIEDITNVKELCYLYIDDRCLRFNGDFKQTKNEIANFSVWYK